MSLIQCVLNAITIFAKHIMALVENIDLLDFLKDYLK